MVTLMPGPQRVMKEMTMFEDLLPSALKPWTLGRCAHHNLRGLLGIRKELRCQLFETRRVQHRQSRNMIAIEVGDTSVNSLGR
jgi:hypothetical protein